MFPPLNTPLIWGQIKGRAMINTVETDAVVHISNERKQNLLVNAYGKNHIFLDGSVLCHHHQLFDPSAT